MARPHDGTWTPLPVPGPPISGKPFARHRTGGDSATPEALQGLGENLLGRALLSSTPVDYFPSYFYQLSNQEGKSSGNLTFSSSPAGRQNFEWIYQHLIQPSRHCCGMTWKLKTTRGLVRHQLWLSVMGCVGRYLLPSQRAGYKKQGWTAGKGPCGTREVSWLFELTLSKIILRRSCPRSAEVLWLFLLLAGKSTKSLYGWDRLSTTDTLSSAGISTGQTDCPHHISWHEGSSSPGRAQAQRGWCEH